MQPIDPSGALITALTTCPDERSASQIARTLVQEKLAACVQRVPGLQSTYVWDGQLHEEPEVLLLIKTVAGALPRVAERVRSLHPYEVPEVLVLPAQSGNEAYADWVRSSVGENAGR